MSTFRGIGTTRYDWRWAHDGAADATLWFVIFFFPIIPLRRERLLVLSSNPLQDVTHPKSFSPFGFLSFTAEFKILGSVPMSFWGVLRTYWMGFVVVPFIALIGPLLLLLLAVSQLQAQNVEFSKPVKNTIGASVALAVIFWPAYVLA